MARDVRKFKPALYLLPLFLGALLAGCGLRDSGPPSESRTLQVFAAASLAEAFQELGEVFSRDNPGIDVNFNFAGSQALARQISHGAPADIFASADEAQMQVAVDSGRIDAGSLRPFATNELVVAYPARNASGVEGLDDLAVPGLAIVLAAEEVPVGQYSLEFLWKASLAGYGEDFREHVLDNVVSYEENVRAILSKVALDEADAGLVYRSDVLGDQANKVGYLTIPADLNVVAVYPVAPLRDSSLHAEGEDFIEFLLSPAAQEILASHGFGPASRGGY
ncbi:MAG: molybdate ABC transporter substrate-binding protein [Anaerolineales bacterium]|nr:molybdate ABC transporter substrate-binding protein [Anaerolineales bacterium]